MQKKEFYRKRAIIFFSFFAVIGSAMIGSSLYLRNKNLDQRSQANEQKPWTKPIIEEDPDKIPPQIINIPPQVAYFNEKYTYPIKIYDPDTKNPDDIKITLEKGPDWLFLINKKLTGTPPDNQENTYKIILKLTDGKNEREEIFYISTKN